MKTNTASLGLLITALTVGTIASGWAAAEQTPGVNSPDTPASCQDGFGPGSHQDRSEFFEKRLSALQTELKLAPEQRSAWDEWAGHVRSQVTAIKEQRPDPKAMEGLTAPEKMEKWLAFGKERQAKLEDGLVFTRKFYEGLTTEQRKTFDLSFDFFRPGGWKTHHRPRR